jgi:tetraacyldisaccharide 4'-kinase
LGLFSAIYRLGLACKRFSCRKPDRLPAKVISIGNLTLGGTGKTPAVIAVAREAKKRGHNTCVLTRGYKGKTGGISFVSRGAGPLMTPLESGDEACMMAEKLKRVTIVKGKDRFSAGIAAFDNARRADACQDPDLFILDDGYQHWKLHRDIDILLIDATNPFGNERLFPEGTLREPFSAMKRAHIILITKADMVAQGEITEITHKIKKYNPDAPVFSSSYSPVGLINISGEKRSVDSLRDKRIYAFSGIANPAYFRSLLISSGAQIEKFRKFRDHFNYRMKDIDEIKKEASGLEIITTEKDLVKLKELTIQGNIFALKIEFSADNEFYDDLFKIVDQN